MDSQDFTNWPEVPKEQRPKRFYTNVGLGPEEIVSLESKGWEIVDVRLLPENSDDERQEAVRAWLWGITNGTIETSGRNLKDFIDLKAKACGLIGAKEAQTTAPTLLNKDDIDALLTVGPGRAFMGTHGQNDESMVKQSKPVRKKKK